MEQTSLFINGNEMEKWILELIKEIRKSQKGQETPKEVDAQMNSENLRSNNEIKNKAIYADLDSVNKGNSTNELNSQEEKFKNLLRNLR